jgi:hypothetical protein
VYLLVPLKILNNWLMQGTWNMLNQIKVFLWGVPVIGSDFLTGKGNVHPITGHEGPEVK